jgi:hypothetical protein
MQANWYYSRHQQRHGPVLFEELRQLAQSNQLEPGDMLWQQGTDAWVPAGSVDGLFEPVSALVESGIGVGPAPPPLPPHGLVAGAPGGYAPPGVYPRSEEEYDDGANALAGFGTYLWLQIKRAWAWNAGAVEVSEPERAALSARGIDELTSQRYLVWRRSVLLMVVVLGTISGISGAISQLSSIDLMRSLPADFRQAAPDFRLGWNALGILLILVSTLAQFSVPAAALLGMLWWARVKHSRRVIVVGMLVSLLPLLPLLIPMRWLIYVAGLPPQVSERDLDTFFMGINLALGLAGFFLLLPIVLSVVTGASRGCMKIKTLLPASIFPGWLLVMASYLQVLIFMVFLLIINLIAGNVLLILTAILVLAVPVVYIVFTRLFIQPMSPQEMPIILAPVRWSHLGLVLAASLFFFVYLMTARVLGDKPLVGFDQNALMNPFELIGHAINFVGRALFMAVLAVDQFMRVNLSVWTDSIRFVQTEHAAHYGHVMSKLQETMQKD